MDVTKLPVYRKARMGLAYLPQYGNIAAGLTVEENLRISGYLLNQDEIDGRISDILDVPKAEGVLEEESWYFERRREENARYRDVSHEETQGPIAR